MTAAKEPGQIVETHSDGVEQDKELVLSFQSGASEAYDTIYRLYSPRVQRVCRRMLVRREDAEEAVQETFLRVYLALPRFNGRYQLGGWITRIATNVCLDRIRSSSRRPVDSTPLPDLENDLVDHGDSDPEARSIRNAESRRVTRVLLRLPAIHRAAIVLRDIEGMSYAEVAQTLGLSEVQTKALIHRARQGFRRSWTSVASAFLPAKLANRVRDAVDSTRHQIADLVSPATHAATQCSIIVQQCGNYLADKAASMTTVVVVAGAASAGAVAVASTPRPAPSPPPRAAEAAPEVSVRASGESPLGEDEGSAEDESPTRVVATGSPEPIPPPTETPTAPPSASPPPAAEPTPTAAPSGEPTPPAKASPAPSATPAPVAALPVTDVRFDQGQASDPRPATAGRSTADCGARKVSQTLDVPVNTSRGTYQGKLTLSVNGSAGFELEVVDGSYSVRYVGGGPLDRVEQPASGQLRLISSGVFGTGSPYAAALGLPDSGRFSVDLTLDCASASVITETLILQR